MDKIVSSRGAPQSWIDAIEQSGAEPAPGQLLDLDDVMRELDAEDAANSAPAAKPSVSRTSSKTTNK